MAASEASLAAFCRGQEAKHTISLPDPFGDFSESYLELGSQSFLLGNQLCDLALRIKDIPRATVQLCQNRSRAVLGGFRLQAQRRDLLYETRIDDF